MMSTSADKNYWSIGVDWPPFKAPRSICPPTHFALASLVRHRSSEQYWWSQLIRRPRLGTRLMTNLHLFQFFVDFFLQHDVQQVGRKLKVDGKFATSCAALVKKRTERSKWNKIRWNKSGSARLLFYFISFYLCRSVCIFTIVSLCYIHLSLIHIWRCRRIERCRSRWSPYH